MSEKFASSDLTIGQLNALVKKLGGRDAVLKFLRGELSVFDPGRKWHEKDGVIFFSVTSDGTTGEEWIIRLEEKGFSVGEHAKCMLRNKDFKPTTGITTEVAVLKGMLFSDKERVTENIHKVAAVRKLQTPNTEIACLIRDKFTDEEIRAMGLTWIISMNRMNNDLYLGSTLLCVTRNKGVGLGACLNRINYSWQFEHGFAFVVPHMGTQN